MTTLFPDYSLDNHREGSTAIAPLIRNGELIGALTIGSSDARRYDKSIGTLFLEHLAEVVVRLPFINHSPAP